jgi:surface polysaccharide O-acyltransferase-like enzyme
MEGRKRQAGIELLRMVAMMMIVTMHFLANSGNLLEPGKQSDLSAVLGTILENFCLAAVNAYVFISGYFGYQGTFQVKRVLRFLCQIWFYSLLVPLVLMGLGISTGFQNGIYGILPYLFPIETEHYWFATSFLLLMLLMPFLNLAFRRKPIRRHLSYSLYF